MKTKNLKDLKKLVPSNFVGGARPGMTFTSPKYSFRKHCVKKEYTEDEILAKQLAKIPRMLFIEYNKRMYPYRKEIERITKVLYNKPLAYPDKDTIRIYEEYTTLLLDTTSAEELTADFKKAIGKYYNAFRKDPQTGKFIPIECHRFKTAWYALQRGDDLDKVKTILYL